jgi:hypothetical protein
MQPRLPALRGPETLLLRVSEELAGCVCLLSTIETEVAVLLAASPRSSPASVAALQQIDLLAQTLADLALCLDGLGRSPLPAPGRPDWAEAALHPLRLEDLRARLAGLAAAPAPAGAAVDLF